MGHSTSDYFNRNYVCLSDLHLGADYSLLSNVTSEKDTLGQPALKQNAGLPSETLKNLDKALRETLPGVFSGKEKPTLVLLGDCLDFDFALNNDVAESFRQLMALFFSDNKEPLFNPSEVIYVPGNHDHRLWDYEKDHVFIDNYKPLKTEFSYVKENSTPLFGNKPIQSYFLNALIADLEHCSKPIIKLCYPNWGIKNQDQLVIFHHGHYTEPLYRVITSFNNLILQNEVAIPTAEQVESENGGWVEFLWSSLGNARRTRDSVLHLFEIFRDAAATHKAIQQFAEKFCAYLYQHYGVNPNTQIINGINLQTAVTGILDATLGKGLQIERLDYEHVLSAGSVAGLRWYLDNPVYQSLREEGGEQMQTSFIFGHTHKPFETDFSVNQLLNPVEVFNTGGWVVDGLEPYENKGAACLFVAESGEVASLRLFEEIIPKGKDAVRAEAIQRHQAKKNKLQANIADAISSDSAKSAWSNFSLSMQEGMSVRHQAAQTRFFDPSSNTGDK